MLKSFRKTASCFSVDQISFVPAELDGYTPQGIDDPGELGKIHLDPAIYLQIQEAFQGFAEQGRPSQGIGGIDPVITAAGDGYIQIPQDRGHGYPVTVFLKGAENDGVRSGTHLPLPAVLSDEQQMDRIIMAERKAGGRRNRHRRQRLLRNAGTAAELPGKSRKQHQNQSKGQKAKQGETGCHKNLREIR